MGSCISGGGGGGNAIHDFSYLGKGGEGDKILKCYTFDSFTLSINIHCNYNTLIPCVFLPFLAENYESYLIYVK